MKIATRAQLDRAVKAAREVERLRAILESPDPISSEEWARVAREYADAKAALTKAERVLASIESYNRGCR